MSAPLVLSLFPAIGLLDMQERLDADEAVPCGYCGRKLKWAVIEVSPGGDTDSPDTYHYYMARCQPCGVSFDTERLA